MRPEIIDGKLFIVGDPKQSIYRFRCADIGIYDEVYPRAARPSDRVALSQSFRSPAPLVEWFDHHFEWDMQRVRQVQPEYRFGVRHIVETAAERWQEEAGSVARLAAQIVSGLPRPGLSPTRDLRALAPPASTISAS